MKANCLTAKQPTSSITHGDLSRESEFKNGINSGLVKCYFIILYTHNIFWREPIHKNQTPKPTNLPIATLQSTNMCYMERHTFLIADIDIHLQMVVFAIVMLVFGVVIFSTSSTQLQVVGRDQHRQTSSDTSSRFGEKSVEVLKKNGGPLVDILFLFSSSTGMCVFE